jgi:hypothetical protein
MLLQKVDYLSAHPHISLDQPRGVTTMGVLVNGIGLMVMACPLSGEPRVTFRLVYPPSPSFKEAKTEFSLPKASLKIAFQ